MFDLIKEKLEEWNKQRQVTDKILVDMGQEQYLSKSLQVVIETFQDKERDADSYRSALLNKNDAHGIMSLNSAETFPSISLDTEAVGISHVIDERFWKISQVGVKKN